MADTTRDIWNDDDGEEEQPKKRRALRGFWVFFLTLAAVLAVVVLAAYRDGTGFDVLRRYLNYGSVESVGGEVVYGYDASSNNRFAALGEKLVVLSETSLRVLDRDGGEVWSVNVNMSAPMLNRGGGRAVACDVGGRTLYVVDEGGEVMHLTAGEDEPFIAAALNEKGWLAVTAEKRGYKGCVSVYDQDGELVFEFNSSRRFVIDACVTDDCGYLAAVTLGQENSVFVSNVVLYDVTKTDPAADYDISDGLVAAIGQQAGKLATVSDTCLTFADTSGAVTASYAYGGAYLRDYDLSGDGFVALLLNRYQSGSVGRLVTVDTDGAELGSLDVNEEVLSVSAAGRYLAVLYANRLVVYNQDLQVYASLNGTDYAREALMRTDGSVLLLSSESAGLFLP
ncbi:MAG: DUF5711 family protein [Oscillospiraceae bacterium]|nr:DUF5711 family protein [Oscillospiraceae bacterium]